MTTGRRLLFVVNHAGFFLSHRLSLALAARDAGYDVHVATPKSKHVPRILAAGLAWHEIRLSRSSINPLRELKTIRDIDSLYRRLRPDLVHQVTSKPVLYGTFVARRRRVPAVVNAVTGLGYAFARGGSRLRLFVRYAVSLGYRIAVRHPNMRVIFENREHLTEFVATSRVRERDAVLIAGSGVDMTAFAPAERDGREMTTVLFASRMLYPKGVADFVTAAKLLAGRGVAARFLLAGEPDPDNPESVPEEVLRSWSDGKTINYLGRRDDMPAVFASSDIAVLPTFYSEGVPNVLVEAAATGLPIVTTDWPGCRDVVVDGVNGFLVPPRDPVTLADAVERLIRDPALRRQMGTASRSRAVEMFSLDRALEQTLGIYRELLQ